MGEPNPVPETAYTTEEDPFPATLTANLHVTADQVQARDLAGSRKDPVTGRERGVADAVSLAFGDDHASVSLLGDIDTLARVLEAAVHELRRVGVARREAGR